MGNTPWSVQLAYPDRSVITESSNSGLTVKIEDDRYTVVKCLYPIKEIKRNYFYAFHGTVASQRVNYKLLYIWRDADGQELAKGYFLPGKKVPSPKDCTWMEIEVLVYSQRKGVFQLTDMILEEVGPYVPRKARICAISSYIHTDAQQGRYERTYTEAVSDTLASIDVAAAEKPDMIVLTENVFQTRVPTQEGYGYRYNTLDGKDPDITALCQRAAKYNTYITCSIALVDNEGLRHNTGLLINRQGQIQDTFHKCHLTLDEVEDGIVLGDDLKVFDTDFGRIGILICWDYFFPEAARILAMKGAELVCVPTHGYQQERAVIRAWENGLYFAYAYTFREGTSIISPSRDPYLATAVEKGYAIAEIDFNDLVRWRYLSVNSWGNPYEAHMCERRANIYGKLQENMFPGDNC